MAPGLLLIHDLERAREALVRGRGLEGEAHRANVNVSIDFERMEMVNDLCFRLKRHL